MKRFSIACLFQSAGILYDPADPNGLRQALWCCLTLDLKAMAQRAYEQVQQFTWEALAEKTLEAYNFDQATRVSQAT
ncbi:MAG: hypothetical protein H8E47_05545 [Anaerolineales bacterium]|nr:hypothetical protein [Anaerolineales bacterium]